MMSTSHLSKRCRQGWSKPVVISSSSLDALFKMSSSSGEDAKSSSDETGSLQSPVKESPRSEETKTKLNCLKFRPSQLVLKDKGISRTERVGVKNNFQQDRSSDSSNSILDSRNTTPPKKIQFTSEGKADDSLQVNSDDENFRTPSSTVCYTPRESPTTPRSSDFSNKFRYKRSFNDQYKDESLNSSYSSLNNTAFYTPESSPGDYGSSIKRQRIEWSGSRSYNCTDYSYSESLNDSRISVKSSEAIEPELIGYQLVGDSQFCRFGQQLLGLQRVPMPNSPGRIGICVSGQTITDLHRRVKENFYPISDKVILMIGTNDFLRSVDVNTMCNELSSLIKTLQKSAKNIVLLTLPPIPKLERKPHIDHFALLDKYNNFIRGLANGDKVKIADVSPMYINLPLKKCKMHLFELFFGGPARRQDMIHLNRQGLEVIRKYILDKFY